jgi:hypothetical protein
MFDENINKMNFNLKNSTRTIGSIMLCIALISGCIQKQKGFVIYAPSQDAKIQFAINEIKEAIGDTEISLSDQNNEQADIQFIIETDNSEIKPEGFVISQSTDHKIKITASDIPGAMYGGLELAEQLKLHGLEGVKEVTQNPYMELRGAKFNIPLDARSPSYTDASDVAQNNITEMWNFDFWTEYIDNMARYRYNFISFWSLHPFPSLVKLDDYPDIALNDVHKSTAKWDEYYHLHGTGLDAPEILNNYEVVKEISIDEKIEFWKKVMAYGKDRNVDMFFITWNIFINGTFNQYGITESAENEITKDYFRKSIKQMFLTYPDLAGIGLTTGENMPGVKFTEKEQWAFDTYAKGILDAADEMPDRKFTFIHRQHQADPAAIEEMFQPLINHENIEFIYSFKYAKAHVFSATTQPYHEKFAKNIGDLKTIWTLRNDDSYLFRWGSPAYTREFIRNIPHDISRGVYYGSDQWVWGREFTSKNVEEPRQLEVVKHWYHWMMWGRLAYNPQLSDEHFTQMLQDRFPETNATVLFEAWHEASMVYPVTTGFHWGPVDFKWYIEGCRSRPSQAFNETGFHDVNTFIKIPPHVKTGYQSIPDYVKSIKENTSSELTTPIQISEMLHQHADKAMELAQSLENDKNGEELKRTIHDIKTIAAMGKYYAHKIAGSTHYAVYRSTSNSQDQKQAENELTLALESWKAYVKLAAAQTINRIWTNRVGYVDFEKTTEWVKQDIEIASQND